MTHTRTSRREFLKIIGLMGGTAAGLSLLGRCRFSEQPNIIILFSDDAGFADFGLHGSRKIHTPNIDFLGQTGMRFLNGYVTGPVCSPSRAGLMTGRYQQRFGHEYNIGDNFSNTDPELIGLPVGEFTIADFLRSAGYRTGLVGKWHLGTRPQFHPLNRGFESFFGMLGGSSPYLSGRATRILNGFDHVNPEELPYLTDAFGREACRFIEKHRYEPFFLFVSFNAPHAPMQPPPEPPEYEIPFSSEVRKQYSAMMHALDKNIGLILGTLHRLDLDRDTLIFFLNDNGGAMPYNGSCNDPLSGTKGTFLEGGIRVPFLVRWPGVIPAGCIYTEPVSALDILPTAMAAAGAELPADRAFDGINLIPYISGQNQTPPHETLFWRLGHHGAVRKGDWKLIWFDDLPPRLFNLIRDIGEMEDVSNRFPGKVDELLEEFQSWQLLLEDPLWRTHPKWKEHSRKRYDQQYVEGLKRF